MAEPLPHSFIQSFIHPGLTTWPPLWSLPPVGPSLSPRNSGEEGQYLGTDLSGALQTKSKSRLFVSFLRLCPALLLLAGHTEPEHVGG